ncbi:MAG: hypothetical protein ACP5O1_12390 [Phycisphaerae bacterium]
MKSKLLNCALGAVLVAGLSLGVTGCSLFEKTDAPQINVKSDHSSVQVGETVWLHATTSNLSNTSIEWKVSPTNAKLAPDDSRGDQYARFSASQPGGYIVTAYAKTANGGSVVSRITVIVAPPRNE